MATFQAPRPPKANTKIWETIFPNDQVTEQRSALFVKKLLAVAISNITYLRNIFPEGAFGDKCLEDLNLKILRDKSSCPGACQVIKWVKGCFDALDKKYLKTLVIGIYVDPKKPESIIESYTFKFSYQDNGAVDIYRNDEKISCTYTAGETKKATIKLLRTLIILTNTLSPLPDHVMMTMKLLYYDEVTPEEYEPPGFKPAEDDEFVFKEEATNISIGSVSTSFHSVKLRIRTAGKQFEIQDEPLASETSVSTSQSNSKKDKDIKRIDQGQKVTCGDNVTKSVQEITCEGDATKSVQEVTCENDATNSGLEATCEGDATNSVQEVTCEGDATNSVQEVACENDATKSGQEVTFEVTDATEITNKDETEMADEEDFKVRCPCGCNEDDGLMIMCGNCKFWQHGVCFLVTNEDKAPESHICDICAKPGDPDLSPTDPELCGMASIAVQATCLWRRALTVCTEFKRLVAPELARRLGIENTVAQGLINRMEKEGFISKSSRGKKVGKIVNKGKIESEGIPTYLKTPKTLRKKEADDCIMDCHEYAAENPMEETSTTVDKEIGSLAAETKKMNLEGRKTAAKSSKERRKTVGKSSQEISSTSKTDSKIPSRKRAYSKTSDAHFELVASQETPSGGRKKASKVSKDITV